MFIYRIHPSNIYEYVMPIDTPNAGRVESYADLLKWLLILGIHEPDHPTPPPRNSLNSQVRMCLVSNLEHEMRDFPTCI